MKILMLIMLIKKIDEVEVILTFKTSLLLTFCTLNCEMKGLFDLIVQRCNRLGC